MGGLEVIMWASSVSWLCKGCSNLCLMFYANVLVCNCECPPPLKCALDEILHVPCWCLIILQYVQGTKLSGIWGMEVGGPQVEGGLGV